MKCKEQRLIGFEGYNCGSTAVVKCRWAALLHQLPQSKNRVVAASILPFTNLLYLTLQLSHSNLYELFVSCILFCIGIIEMRRATQKKWSYAWISGPWKFTFYFKVHLNIFHLKKPKNRLKFPVNFSSGGFKCDYFLMI